MKEKLSLKDKVIVGLCVITAPVLFLASALQHSAKVEDNRCKLKSSTSMSKTYVCDKTNDGNPDTLWYHSIEKPSFETEASKEDVSWYNWQI